MSEEKNEKRKPPTIMNNEVAIFRDAKGELKIIPDYIFFKKTSFVKFLAVNINVVVMVPNLKLREGKRDFCEKTEPLYSSFQVKKGQLKKVYLKEKSKTDSGEYPYIVHCIESGETIKGNSPPSMIVIEDPPKN